MTTNQETGTGNTLRARLTLDVEYALNGTTREEMVSQLEKLCESAIGNGMLTGCTAAEVEQYAMKATAVDSSPADQKADAPVIVVLKTNCAPVVNEVFANRAGVKIIFVDEDTEGCNADSIRLVEGATSYVGVHLAEHDGQRAANICVELRADADCEKELERDRHNCDEC